MPYIATKPRMIAGQRYERGQVVDTSNLTVAKLATLSRIGLLVQSDDPDAIAMMPTGHVAPPVRQSEAVEAEVADNEGMCPICDAGPYRNVRSHITRSHEDVDPSIPLDALGSEQEPEEEA